MRKSITVWTAAVAAVALLGGVSGCSTTTPAEEGTVNLSFLTFETPALGAEFWDSSIAAAVEAVPGISVTKIISPDIDRNAYAKQLQASGQFPDVLASITVSDFTEAGLLEPFPQAWLDENFLLPNGTGSDGLTYIPPANAQVIPFVYYNKTIFADNNIDEPRNYAEFVSVVKQLKAAGVTPIELAGADPWSASMPLVALASADVLGNNPEWIQERYTGSVQFADSEFESAMQKHLDLIEMGAYSDTALSVDFPTANQDFLDGKAGMYIMGSWFTGSGYVTPEQADNIGAFPFPTDDGKLVVAFSVGGTTAVSSKSEHVAEAIAFAQAWSTAPSSMTTLIETDGAFPLLKKVPFEDFNATVNSLFTHAYTFVTDENTKVSGFGWANNADTLAPGINDKFYALSQSLFSNKDLKSQLAELDVEWDKATK